MATPGYGWILLGTALILLLIVVVRSIQDRRFRRSITDLSRWNALAASIDPVRRRVRQILFGLALFFLLFASGRPQFGESREAIRREGADILIVLDISPSMLAEDVAPYRLARSIQELSRWVERRPSDRFGLVVFSGRAVRVCPLTIDRSALITLLRQVSVGMISETGSAIDQGLEIGYRLLPKEERRHQTILLVSDGETVEPAIESAALAHSQKFSSEGIKIFTVGVGTENGKPIPIRNAEGAVVEFRKDPSGSIVISRLNERFLTEIAKRTGGEFFRMSHELPSALDQAFRAVETRALSERVVTRYGERYQPFLLAGVLAYFLFLILSERRR